MIFQSGRPEYASSPKLTITWKLSQLNWSLIVLVTMAVAVGLSMLYSAAGGDWHPWAHRHLLRYGIGLTLAIGIALVDLRLLMRLSYLAYAIVLCLLAMVEIVGEIGMGAQRWVDLGLIQLQPSELMKFALVLALARYFHGRTFDEVGRPLQLLLPLGMVIAPVILVMRQPDLGTAVMILLGGAVMFFLAGVRIWIFATLILLGIALVPIAWQFLLEYQKNRVLTFLNPESDPLGAGYHILQSKIALGSGGLMGKGFLQGSQSHLNFLPEKQTDFIFTMFAEEFGLIGGLGIIILFVLIIGYGIAVSLMIQSQFGRLLSLGMTTTLFLYVFINIAMVMGLIPVVGVPLPFISYGGTALLSAMAAIGLIMCAYIHRDIQINRRGVEEN